MSQAVTIGVFDSGLGGLSVLREIRRRVPHADLIYCADQAFFPYGERPGCVVRERALCISEALLGADAQALVIACNTATAAAAESLRARSAVPIVGMEPAVKPAAAATRSGVVGVLGTGGTLRSARFAALLDRFAGYVRVVTRPAPELVEAVERGESEPPVRAAVEPLLAAGADVIVLGCTHFSFLRSAIAEVAGSGVHLIDTGAAVARRLRDCLPATAEQAVDRRGAVRFWTTGDCRRSVAAITALWGEPITLAPAPLAPSERA